MSHLFSFSPLITTNTAQNAINYNEIRWLLAFMSVNWSYTLLWLSAEICFMTLRYINHDWHWHGRWLPVYTFNLATLVHKCLNVVRRRTSLTTVTKLSAIKQDSQPQRCGIKVNLIRRQNVWCCWAVWMEQPACHSQLVTVVHDIFKPS